MKCARCGLDLPAGTKQCPKCGLINEFVHSPDNKKRSPLLYAIIGLAALGLIALVVMLAAGNRNPTAAPPGVQREDTNIMAAPPAAPPESGIMAAPPSEPPTEKTPADVSKPKPPQSVVDYLAYVQKVEEHRQTLLKDRDAALKLVYGGGGLMSLIDLANDPEGKEAQDPLADTKKELNRQYKNWLQTLKFFDNKPAPAECREFSGEYRNVLYLETKAIGQTAAGFNSVNIMDSGDMFKSLGALQKRLSDSSIQGNMDKAADGADAQLKALVANYDMEKPFNVPREERGGNIMGF